jgi:hypothetical protein
MARSRGTGLKREGPHGAAPGRTGRCSSATARTHWVCIPNPTPAATRAHRGGMGVSRDSPGLWARNVIDGNGRSFMFWENHEQAFDN